MTETPENSETLPAETPTSEPAGQPVSDDAPLDHDLAAGYAHTSHGADEQLNVKAVVITCAVLLVGAIGIAGALAKSRKKPPSRTPPPVVVGVRVAAVSAEAIRPTVLGLGRARPLRRVQISTQVAGLASSVHPALKSGAVLPADVVAVEVDSSDYRVAHDQLRAQLAGAEADQARLDTTVAFVDSRLNTTKRLLALEQKDLARIERLNKRGIANDRELNAARLVALRTSNTLTALRSTRAALAPDLRKAGARVSEIQALLTRAQSDLDRCTIRLPFAGQVAQVKVEAHQLLTRGQVLFEVWQIDRVELPIVLSLGEAHLFARDLGGFASGKAPPAHVTYESRGEVLTWRGTLKRFETVDGDTQTVKAVVEVDNANQETPLAPDLFCKVTLQAPPVEAGLSIPIDGLRERSRVYVVRDGKLRILKVVTGRRLGTRVVIREGLESGEQVITSPLERAIEGMAVEVIAQDASVPARERSK